MESFMGNNKLAVTDCDDCLLLWKEGYLKWMLEKGWNTKPEHECTTWEMAEWFYPNKGVNMTPELSIHYITEFNSFPRVLHPLDYVFPAIDLLEASGYDIKVLSSFGSCPENNKFREEYLKMMFGSCISEVIILGLGECKKGKLKELQPDIFIEDNKSHAEKAIELGIKTYLISTPYNQGCEGAVYFEDWSKFKL